MYNVGGLRGVRKKSFLSGEKRNANNIWSTAFEWTIVLEKGRARERRQFYFVFEAIVAKQSRQENSLDSR